MLKPCSRMPLRSLTLLARQARAGRPDDNLLQRLNKVLFPHSNFPNSEVACHNARSHFLPEIGCSNGAWFQQLRQISSSCTCSISNLGEASRSDHPPRRMSQSFKGGKALHCIHDIPSRVLLSEMLMRFSIDNKLHFITYESYRSHTQNKYFSTTVRAEHWHL
jgi:hypothetical protein